MSEKLWLIGFRAAGKSTLGRALAGELGWQFRDVDELFEQRNGPILAFVDRHGIERFRAGEQALLAEVAGEAQPGLVVATGGGFVDWDASRKLVAEAAGAKAWLDPPAAELWERLKVSPERQKIGDLSDFSAMQKLLEKRRPFYEKIATSRLVSQDISECLALLKCLAAKR